MAWWTYLLFLGPLERREFQINQGEGISGVLKRALREYLYNNFVEILYVSLGVITYCYLALTIAAFFFEQHVPGIVPHLVDIFSEPYLGALGIYVVVREIEHRRGKHTKNRWGDLVAAAWILFLVAATTLTYVSENYHITGVYKIVVTNALAALIIRIGTILR